jgi:hypothetical protein
MYHYIASDRVHAAYRKVVEGRAPRALLPDIRRVYARAHLTEFFTADEEAVVKSVEATCSNSTRPSRKLYIVAQT